MNIKNLFMVLLVAVVLEGCAAPNNRVQFNGSAALNGAVLQNGAMLNNGAMLANGLSLSNGAILANNARRAALTALAARPLTKQD